MARQREGVLAILFRALLLALGAMLVAAQGKPTSAVSLFQNLPARLFFFDDTDSAIYHDPLEANLYVSRDEGRTWKLADGIPEGKVVMVFEHPTDNHYAFALTNEKTHYRTEDRGRSWRPFDVPLPPALTSRPLSFHSDPTKYGHILYQGSSCSHRGMSTSCHDEAYYTTQAFGDDLKPLFKDVARCQFAHSSKEFKHEAHEDLIYCVAFDTNSSSGGHSLSASKLYSSTDFFDKDVKVEDLGTGKIARGVITFATVGKFAVVTLKDMSKSVGNILLYVTVDTKTWAQAHFPSSVQLRPNAYTTLESTTHSLAVDVVLQEKSPIGTLFISNGNGTYFVESLKDTNRNSLGYVDFERIYGVEGIGLANVVANAAAVERRGAVKSIRTVATFDDGSSWVSLRPPIEDVDGKTIQCDPKNSDDCTLHLHSVTSPQNFGRISSPAPGIVMGVGSIGKHLLSYEECDTFLSTNAGVSWRMVAHGAHKYEFGDLGSILIAVDDEDVTKEIKYSLDLGKSWKTYDFGVRLRARGLITLPDSTSQKFLLLGQVAKADQTKEVGSAVIVYLDFAKTRGRKCTDNDFQRWYARPHDSECLLGHKQWYKRKKPDADCYVGENHKDPVVHEDPCACTDADYECDYNFIRVGDKCEPPQGHEEVPPNVCRPGRPGDEYEGSSGYRKIAGDTCAGGLKKDAPVMRKCSQATPPEGDLASHFNSFDSPNVQQTFSQDSNIII